MLKRRWPQMTALLAVGIAIGVLLSAPPVTAHIGSVTHLWSQHIKPRADARYMNDQVASVSSGEAIGSELSGDGVGNDDNVCEANEVCFQAAICPDGSYYVLEGGYQGVNPGSQVVRTGPVAAFTYQVFVANDGSPDPFTATATCIKH